MGLTILALILVLTGVPMSIVRLQVKASEYSRLRRDILNRSSILDKIPPNLVTDTGNSSNLNISVYFVDVLNIDQVTQILNCIVLIKIQWILEDLAWNPEDFQGLSHIELDSSLVWLPRLMVSIGDKDSLHLELSSTITVQSTGIIATSQHNYMSFRCSVDFTRYPFDVQTCEFGLYPMNDHFPNITFEIRIFPNTGIYDFTGEWQWVNYSYEMVSRSYLRPFPRTALTVKRKPVYYVIVLIFPMVLTSLLIPLVFVIPARSGEKMSYLVAVLTSTAIFITLISDVMPRGLSSIPYLAMLLMEVLLEGLCAILASLLVVNKYEQEQLLLRSLRTSVLSKVQYEGEINQDIKDKQDEHSSVPYKATPITSRLLDNLFVTLFGIGQFVFLASLFCLTDWLHDIHLYQCTDLRDKY